MKAHQAKAWSRLRWACLAVCVCQSRAFRPSPLVSRNKYATILGSRSKSFLGAKLQVKDESDVGEFNPFDFETGLSESPRTTGNNVAAAALAAATSLAMVPAAHAGSVSTGAFDPANFKPVCSTSDGFYRFLQGTTQTLVGDEAFVEYGPLIAGGLLRIRLELCVVESFFQEAVIPFIQKNGISWVLPLRETVETFLAGSVFALATTFILVSSTKIVAVVITYADFLVGLPCRIFGGFAFDRALGKPVTLELGIGPFKKQVLGPKKGEWRPSYVDPNDDSKIDINKIPPTQAPGLILTGIVKGIGEACGFTKDVVEAIDLFVGRYLTLLATGYIALKFVHFKIFPDFPFSESLHYF